MTKKILNNVDHKDLKIDLRATQAFGDHVNRTLIFSSEFSELHKEFPILIHRDENTQELHAHAILGFEKDENLFLENEAWQSTHIPATLARGPFSIGLQKSDQQQGQAEDVVIMLDEADPRCGGDGESVFLEQGGESPYLEYVKKVLQVIDAGISLDKVLFALLQEFKLLEEVAITINLTEDSQIEFKNYFTIDQEALARLGGDVLAKLNQAGVLGLAYFMVSSLANFTQLIDKKNMKTMAGL
ncbi:SapC family protein [Halioxenophilus aromaticivorans]|uniref:SapC family protein n=1 Tax=Halioxenophilus aromaticivorans TaxID=1306992 RepID=A0AAV3U9P1_9ALTE